MQKRKLGLTDMDLSIVGLGTWAIGGGEWEFGWGAQDNHDSTKAIEKAVEEGINWIDTAAAYGFGHAEEVVGKAVKNLRNKPYIATKCGVVNAGEGKVMRMLKPESIRREIEQSLRRLQVDAIDLYQIHWPTPDADIEAAWETMAQLVGEGKVRYAGVSNFSVEQLERIAPIHPVSSLQPPYSMLRREVEAGLLPYCADHNIGVIAYSPMQKGLLTGKITTDWVEHLPNNDHRRRDVMFQEPELSANITLADGLRQIAETRKMTAAQLAVAWVLRRREITAAIVGARRPDQIEETVKAGQWSLAEEEISRVESLLDERNNKLRSPIA